MKYNYTAKSFNGETKTGTSEAKDVRQLAGSLKQEGLILIRAEDVSRKAKKFEISFFGPSLSEKMFFTRNLQIMISAGLPLPRAIETLSLQAKNQKFKKALLGVKNELINGRSFSEAVAEYPGIFPDIFQNMIRVGEEGGSLENVLKILAIHMERQADLASKIKGAMIYPSVIIIAMMGVGVLMLIMVVPKLAEAFKDLNIKLPITTRLIMAFADFLTKKWYLAALGSILLALAAWRIFRSKKGRKIIDGIILKLPVVSKFVKDANTAQTARTLSSLISSGISLPKALEITAGTIGNDKYKKALFRVRDGVKKGEKLSELLKAHQDIYPPTLVQMVSIGEETGETSAVLQKIAEFYEEEVSSATKNLSSVIEPVLMIVIGSAVGFFAISMIQPMYTMLGAIE